MSTTAIATEALGSPRVVVLGVGAVTSQGIGADALWEGARSGRVAIRPVAHLSMDGYPTRLAGEVVDPPSVGPAGPGGFRDRAFDFAVAAADEALEGHRALLERVQPERRALVLGTCNGGLLSGMRWLDDEHADPDPRLAANVPPQALAEFVAARHSLRGPVLSINTACAASANAIGHATDLLRSGQAEIALAGGSDALSHIVLAGLDSLESLSSEPARPYDSERSGLSLGEGSGMLLLVREDLLDERDDDPLAEVLGYGLSADGHHPTAPQQEGEGVARAIRSALAGAGVRPDEVGYVNGHGTGTPKNDPAEARGTHHVLREANGKVMVSSTKSMIGHLLGAAGAAEAIVTVGALREQLAPPTAGLATTDPACPVEVVGPQARTHPMEVAVSNNFAFGGANASLVLARARSRAAPVPLPQRDRVVVTGLALLTPAGSAPHDAWRALIQSGDCTSIDPEHGVRLGRCEVDPSAHFDRRQLRRLDRISVFALLSSRLALLDAGQDVVQGREERVGVMLGTGVGPMESIERFARPVRAFGPHAANAAVFPNTVFNQAAGRVAEDLRVLGPTSTVTTGHAAGASALAYAFDLVATGRAEAMLVPAADALTDTVIRAYRGLGLLRGQTGTGMALAEGGAALVLERLDSARQRGARVYAEILGHATASDGLGVGRTDPRGVGVERAIRHAAGRGGLRLSSVAEVWASANGSRLVDVPERRAMQRAFGSRQPRVWRPRTLLGEPGGAGGALSAALAALSQHHGVAGGHSLLNSTSLGGTHVSLVLGPPPDSQGPVVTAVAA